MDRSLNNNPIAVMDSGIGGLTVLKILTKKFPHENFLYLSDLANMPYGDKSSERVKSLCVKNFLRARKYKPKAIVVACNTMSVHGEQILRKISDLPIFFVKPDIKKIYEYSPEKCLLLCTPTCAKSAPISALSNICSSCIIADGELAKSIEREGEEGGIFVLSKYREQIEKSAYIFLGCTHYIFLQKIIENWNERATIFNGTEKFIKKIGDFCPQKDTLQFGVVKFIGSGAKKVKSVFLKMQ